MLLSNRLFKLVLAGLAVGAVSAVQASPVPYVASMGGTLTQVDIPPNTESLYGATTFATESLAISASGKLYSVDASGFLYDVTGASPILLNIVAGGMVGDLDADALGLWGYDNGADQVFYFDFGGNVVTYYASVAGLSGADIHGVAYDSSDGSLYMSDANNVLYHLLNPFVPVAATIGAMAHGDSGHISDIDFDPLTGDLYAMTWANRHFYQVSTSNAGVTYVSGPGTGTLDSTGMAMPNPVPEPASLAALGLGLAVLGRRRRRQS